MNTTNHKASDRNKVIIAEIRKLLDELEGNIVDKSPIAEIGHNFWNWAESFFSEASGRLNCYVPALYAFQQSGKETGIYLPSPKVFLSKISRYAQLKDMTLNPAELQNRHGRVIRRSNDLHYDLTNQKWVKNGFFKTQSMIYIHTPGSDITESVYDPTEVSRDFESVETEDQHRHHLTTKVQIPD